MGRTGSRFLSVFVLACVFSLVVAGSALAAVQNPECLSCHTGLGQDWTVGDVDLDTACVKCHTYGLAGTHPYHNAGGNCGAVCHQSRGWGESLQFAVPRVMTARGSFASAASSDTTASVLHVIHSNPRWPATASASVSKCGSCHAAAACDACHSNAPDAGHAAHSATGNAGYTATPAQYNPQAPWSGTMGHGIIGEDQLLDTAMTVSSQCAASGCHDIAGSAALKPLTKEDFNHPAYPQYGYPEANSVSMTGSWLKKSGSAYTGGSVTYSNYVGATFTFTMNGEYFELLTDVDPFRGQAEVLIDGTPAGVIDCYSPATKQQQVVFRSQKMAAGAHSVTIRVLGTKQAAAQGTWVFVDALRAFSNLPATVAPKCATCHPDRTAAHGTSFAHEASSTAFTAGTYQLSGSGVAISCSSCHQKKFIDEHKRTSAKTQPDSCAACHTTYAPYSLDTYDYSCSWNLYGPGCHQAANGHAAHNFSDTNHTASDAATAECRSCHGSNLAVIHDDSNPSRPQHASLSGGGANGLAYTDSSGAGCLWCHGTTKAPATKDCTSAGCHTGSGVVSMATHPAPPHTAAPLATEATRTGGLACATCHRVDLTDEHFKGSSLTSTLATIACSSCHSASYFPTGWITPPNNTCIACHPANASKAGAPHEATDYAAKHDFGAYAAANTASCGGANCHNVALADVIHASANPGNGSCTSCHDTPASVPTEHLCADCHAAHPAGVHTSSRTECTSCHTDKTDISTGHAACATCHANPVLTDYLKNNYTSDCVTCHNATNDWDGGGAFTPYAYTPADANHYTPYLANHTASPWTTAAQAAGGDGVTPTEGKECSACHTSALKAAHANTSTSGGSVTCVECHTNTTLNAAAEVTANWANNKCKDCHDYGAATTHDAYTSAHAASTARGCAGSGSGCHGSETNLAKLHNVSQSGGAPKYSSCSNSDTGEACHTVANTRPAKVWSGTDSCGSGSAGCHTEKTTSNHGADHTYTASSNTSVTAMTGCTNSGAGCHGTKTVPGDAVTDYHTQGAIDCLTSKCHTSPTMDAAWKAGGSGAECSRCHAGNFVNAVDAIALTDAAPSGHYGETTHTAGSMTSTVSAGGSTTATCTNCHNGAAAGIDGLYAQHQGFPLSQVTSATYQNITCGQCHNYSVAVSAIVTTSWPTKTCAACHDGTAGKAQAQHASTAPVVTGTSPASCGATGINCHATNDLHALHKSAAGGCNLTGCHDYTKQGLKPTTKSCGTGGGACHGTYTVNSHTHATDAAKHQPSASTQASATTFYSTACGACHDIRTSNSSLTLEHALSTSAKTTDATNNCRNCHNNAASTTAITSDWSSKNTTSACAQCHTAALAIHADKNSAAHADVTSPGCSSTGVGCHNSADLSNVGVTNVVNTNIHANCLRCHDRTATAPNLAYNPANDTCGSGRECHAVAGQYNTSTYVHNGGGGLADGNDGAHHTATGMASTVTSGTATNVCTDCHTATLGVAHATTSLGAVGCSTGGTGNVGCHNSTAIAAAPTQVKASWSNDLCSDCHTVHDALNTAHTGTSTQSCGASGNGCHNTYNLVTLHNKKANGCRLSGCHTTKDARPTAKTCGSGQACHNTYTATGHGTITGDDTTHTASAMTTKVDGTTYDTGGGNVCTSCHSSTLRTAHTTKAGWTTPYCANCHNSTSPVNSVTAIKTDSWSPNTCDQCHVTRGPGKHTTYTLASHTATIAAGQTCGSATCHATLDVRTLHNKATAGCTVSGTDGKGWTGACHALNKDMGTVPKTCGSGTTGCHTGHTSSNHLPDHDANKASGTPAGTTGQNYADGTNVGCFGGGNGACHFSDLRLEHGTTAYLTAQGQTGATQRTMDGSRGGNADGCSVCHTDMGTAGAYAARSAVQAAITNGDYRCTSCHFETTDAAGTTGVRAPHTTTERVSPAPQGTTFEFTSTSAGNNPNNAGGGHNSFASNSFPHTTFGTVNGVNVTGTWGFNGGLISPWTTSSRVLCSDCHQKTTAPNGPQGASVPYYINGGTTVSNWAHTTLVRNMNATNIPAPCNRCHNDLSSGLHDRSAHATNMQCRNCHVEIAHAWRRPRLLRRTIGDNGAVGGTSGGVPADTAPYVDTAADGTNGFIRGIIVNATAPTPAQGDCVSGGCNAHNSGFSSGTLWP